MSIESFYKSNHLNLFYVKCESKRRYTGQFYKTLLSLRYIKNRWKLTQHKATKIVFFTISYAVFQVYTFYI